MSKQNTIRAAASMMFVQLLPSRAEVGNKMFRRNVMHYLCETFDCTVPAAATHYNYAFQDVKNNTPAWVVGLGRAEGKNNGGRKKQLMQLTAQELCGPQQPASSPDNSLTPNLGPVQTEFCVKRSRDGMVVSAGMSFEAARAMVWRAAAGKKAKLYWL